MYEVLPSFILGFHGCDRDVSEEVFAGRATLRQSENNYDWLGHGIYFWENNPQRALEYARLLQSRSHARSRVIHPCVIGAVIDLGYCMNLLDSQFLDMVKNGYVSLDAALKLAGQPLPQNRATGRSNELLIRDLDCAVIEMVHQIRNDREDKSFDSVRGVFVEGEELYPGAGFRARNHIQVCVRNPQCIKGYFRVIED